MNKYLSFLLLTFIFVFSFFVNLQNVNAQTCAQVCTEAQYAGRSCGGELTAYLCGNSRDCRQVQESNGMCRNWCTCDIGVQGRSFSSCSGSARNSDLSCNYWGGFCQVFSDIRKGWSGLSYPCDGGDGDGDGGGGGFCGDGTCNNGETYATCPSDNCPPPTTSPSFTISVSPLTNSALNGETKIYNVTVTPTNSAAEGAYTFTTPIPGCPAGATCVYNGGNTASTGTDTSYLTGDTYVTPAFRQVFVTATSTAVGTYTLVFSAKKDNTSVTQSTSANFIMNPGINNASCTSISAPNSVVAGATFSGTIVMKNIGSKIWDSIYTSPTDMAHSLGSSNPIDNLRWGPSSGRTALPGGTPIAPGQPVTFTKNFTAPSTTGTYSFNFRMVEDAVQWFGEECVKSITVTAPTPVPVVTISASPTSGVVGFNATITWSATNNPTACTATGDWVATPALATASNQTQSQGILSTSGQRQYILTCSNASGSGLSANAVVNVNPVVVNSYRLFITKSGQGTVTSSPAGINCGITCQADFAEGTNIIITAIPNAGRIFTGWGGACVGVLRKPSGPSTCTRTMQSNNINVIANFAVDPSYKEF